MQPLKTTKLIPGTLMHRWREEWETEKRKKVSILETLAYPPGTNKQSTMIEDIQTEVLPSIPPATPHHEITPPPAPICPPFYEHHSNSYDPVSMLFETIVQCKRKKGVIPECLFVAPVIEQFLIAEYEKYTGAPYDGHFYFACNGKTIERIPVYPEQFLPDMLAYAIDGRIAPAQCIALLEC